MSDTLPRKAVVDFADDMERKLKIYESKGGWEGCDYFWLRDRILMELAEVTQELYKLCNAEGGLGKTRCLSDLIDECADVANFAMMIADNARRELKGLENAASQQSNKT